MPNFACNWRQPELIQGLMKIVQQPLESVRGGGHDEQGNLVV